MPTLTFGNDSEYVRFELEDPVDLEAWGVEARLTASIGPYRVDLGDHTTTVYINNLRELRDQVEAVHRTLRGTIAFHAELADLRGTVDKRGRLLWEARIRNYLHLPDELFATMDGDQTALLPLLREIDVILGRRVTR